MDRFPKIIIPEKNDFIYALTIPDILLESVENLHVFVSTTPLKTIEACYTINGNVIKIPFRDLDRGAYNLWVTFTKDGQRISYNYNEAFRIVAWNNQYINWEQYKEGSELAVEAGVALVVDFACEDFQYLWNTLNAIEGAKEDAEVAAKEAHEAAEYARQEGDKAKEISQKILHDADEAIKATDAANTAAIFADSARRQLTDTFNEKVAALDADYAQKKQALDTDYANVKQSLGTDYANTKAALDSEYTAKKAALEADYKSVKDALSASYREALNSLNSRMSVIESQYMTDKASWQREVGAMLAKFEQDFATAEADREARVSAAIASANTAATQAGNVNAELTGTMLTITNRDGQSRSVDTKGEKGDKGDSITMFPNVTIFGQPIIQESQISGFTAQNYVQFPFVVDFAGRYWQLDCSITTGADVSQQHNVFDSNFGLAFAFSGGKFVLAMSSNGTSWNLGATSGTHTILANTTYYIRISWDGATYKLAYSTDKESYIDDIVVASAESLYPRQIVIGKDLANLHIFNGSINMSDAHLSISGKIVWEGMDDAGLATRMAIDLSNIDAEGKQKLNEVAMEGEVGKKIGDLSAEIYGTHGRIPEEKEYHSWLLAGGTYSVSNVYRTKLVIIYPSEKVTIRAGANGVYYAFLKSDNNITKNGGNADLCAEQSRQVMSAYSSVELTAPSDVVYLYVSIWNGTDVAPTLLEIGETTKGLVGKVDDLEQIVASNDLVEAIRRLERNINLAAGEYELNEQLNIPSGTKISGVRGRTIIRVHATQGLVVNNATDVKLQDLTIVGDAPDMPTKSGLQPVSKGSINDYNDALNEVGIGTQIGVVLQASEKVEIYGCEIKNFDAYGLKVVSCGKNYRYAIRVENNWINNCYCGIKTEQEAERSNYFANVISLCQIGAYIDSGTNFFTACSFAANYIGCVFGNGANAAHGHATDCAFTHCTLHGLVCYNLFAGQIFNGCKVGYVDSVDKKYGNAMVVIDSRGVTFNNGYLISAKLYFHGSYEGDDSSAHLLANNMIVNLAQLDVVGCTLHKSNNYYADGSDSSQFND